MVIVMAGRDDEADERRRQQKRRKLKHEESRSGSASERRPQRVVEQKLTKDDLDEYRDVFAKYLMEQKDIHIDEIPSREVYARFKSFVYKWFISDNRTATQNRCFMYMC